MITELDKAAATEELISSLSSTCVFFIKCKCASKMHWLSNASFSLSTLNDTTRHETTERIIRKSVTAKIVQNLN